MLRDITIGQHFPGNSLVHRFDPRLKLVLTIAYIVLLFAASNPLGLALSILFLAAMYKVAKIPGKMILKSLKPILPIVIFTAVLNLFFVSGEGEPLVHIWFLTIYAEGVLNEEANWNNQQKITKEYYLDSYMAKNLYSIKADDVLLCPSDPNAENFFQAKYVVNDDAWFWQSPY